MSAPSTRHHRTPPELDAGKAVFGTMTFGAQVAQSEAEAMVGRCREAGVVMFDTANVYNDGRSEEMLGKIVAPFRDEIQIATKVGGQGPGPSGEGPLAPASIRREIEASLRRLAVDHVDLYYFHRPDPTTPIEESLAAVQELVDEGEVAHLGQSNYAAWQIVDMLHIAAREGWQPVTFSQPMYNLLARRLAEEYVAFSERYPLQTLVYNPLAGGLLTGKHQPDAPPEDNTRFSLKDLYRDRYWNDTMFAAVEELSAVAAEADLSLIELSFQWLLAQPVVSGVILGASRIEHLDANLRALEGPPPTPDVYDKVDGVWRSLRGPVPAYNR